MEQFGFKSSYYTLAWELGFLLDFENVKIVCVPRMILSCHTYMQVVPHQGNFFDVCLVFYHPTSKGSYGAW
jgi:hypothetical protein